MRGNTENVIKTDYTIKDMATQLGITTEGVRYYQKQGIVCFRRNPKTGHAIFRARCVTVLRYVKKLNILGISLSQIRALLQTDNPAAAPKPLKLLEQQKAHELWWDQRMLIETKRLRMDIVRMLENDVSIKFTQMPEYAILMYGTGKMLRKNAALQKRVMAWQKYMPVSFPIMVLAPDELELAYNDCPMGWAFEMEDYSVLQERLESEKAQECALHNQRQNCIYVTFFENGSDTVTMREILSDVLTYIAKRNLYIAGHILIRQAALKETMGEYSIYNEAWIPVEAVEEMGQLP